MDWMVEEYGTTTIEITEQTVGYFKRPIIIKMGTFEYVEEEFDKIINKTSRYYSNPDFDVDVVHISAYEDGWLIRRESIPARKLR